MQELRREGAVPEGQSGTLCASRPRAHERKLRKDGVLEEEKEDLKKEIAVLKELKRGLAQGP